MNATDDSEPFWEDDPNGDVVIREVHRVKEELARLHGFDIRRIAEDARIRQDSYGHIIISQPLPKSEEDEMCRG